MPKIHGGEDGEVGQEFFYRTRGGRMQDANLHDHIIFVAEHAQVDETIMAPIREKYRKKNAKPKKP